VTRNILVRVTPNKSHAGRLLPQTDSALHPRTQQHDADRSSANYPDHRHVAPIGDEAEPAQGVADVGSGAMRATHRELARPALARPLPAQQGLLQVSQRAAERAADVVQLGIELLGAVRASVQTLQLPFEMSGSCRSFGVE